MKSNYKILHKCQSPVGGRTVCAGCSSLSPRFVCRAAKSLG